LGGKVKGFVERFDVSVTSGVGVCTLWRMAGHDDKRHLHGDSRRDGNSTGRIGKANMGRHNRTSLSHATSSLIVILHLPFAKLPAKVHNNSFRSRRSWMLSD